LAFIIRKLSLRKIFAGLMLVAAGAYGCGGGHAQAKRYQLKGKVVAVNKLEGTATISHEEVVGYMPGMTMPFKIKDRAWLETMAPGDKITATLVVDDLQSWLEDIVTTSEAAPDVSTSSGDAVATAKPGDEVPDFALVNQDGKRIHLAEYRGRSLLLTFIYTRCPEPTQCTLMSNNFAEIDRELQKQPDRYARTHLLSISFDPDYDTPKVMRSYGASHTERYSDETFQHWEFASGTADEVKGIAQYFGLRYFVDSESGTQQVIHSLRTAIIGPDGKVFTVYSGNEWKPQEVLSDLIKACEQTTAPKPAASAKQN